MDNLAYRDAPQKYEMIDGQVIAMSPVRTNHAVVSGNIYFMFRSYLQGKPCKVYSDGVKVYLSEKDHFIPDCMVVCNADIVKPNGVYGAPDLVVEVLSPSTMKRDRMYKKQVYAKAGVKEYWIISTAETSLEAYRLQDGRLELDGVYMPFPDMEQYEFSEDDKAMIVTELRCSLFDDLEIHLDKIFEGIIR